jgi:hypothetical protein
MQSDGTQQIPEPGQTGRWRISGTFSEGGRLSRSEQIGDEPELYLDVDSFEGQYMEGSISGTLWEKNVDDEITSTIQANVSFRAGLFDFETFPCIGAGAGAQADANAMTNAYRRGAAQLRLRSP